MSEPSRHVPYDIDVEQAVLGAILLDNTCLDKASETIGPEDFYEPLHARIFEMMAILRDDDETLSPLIIHAVMKTDPGLIEVGGVAYLASMASAAPAMPNVKEYAKILHDLAGRRALIRAGEEMVNRAYETPREAPTAAIAEEISDQLAQVLAGTKEGQKRRPVRASIATQEMLRRIEAQAVADKPHGAKTRISILDEIIGALYPGNLVVVAGRPGMGKSIIGTNFSRHVAEQGVPVDYLSGEMDNDQLAARVGCEIDFDRCQEDRLEPLAYGDFVHLRASGEAIGRLAEANIKLQDLDLDFFDVSGMTLEWIEALCRRRSRVRAGHRVVVIDHLQLVDWQAARRGANRVEIQTEITKRLKGLAKELGITIVLLSQLSRAVEQRDDKHPVLSDLREGGSIEQDADVVIFILRPLVYAKAKLQAAKNEDQRHKAILEYDEAKGVLEIGVAKNRGGRTPDYFKVFINEKASAVRDRAPAGEEADLINWAKMAEDLRG